MKHPTIRDGYAVWDKEKLIDFLITYYNYHKRWPNTTNLKRIRPNNRTIDLYFGSLALAIEEAKGKIDYDKNNW